MQNKIKNEPSLLSNNIVWTAVAVFLLDVRLLLDAVEILISR